MGGTVPLDTSGVNAGYICQYFGTFTVSTGVPPLRIELYDSERFEVELCGFERSELSPTTLNAPNEPYDFERG
jgi:hypothetical protein